MSKLNIYVDGSWLFRACSKEGALSKKVKGESHFQMDFSKLPNVLLEYAKNKDSSCAKLGDMYLCISVFSTNVTGKFNNDENIKKNIKARELFAKSAVSCGFSDEAIIRPKLAQWIVDSYNNHNIQEKQVDTTLVALLVRDAINKRGDFFAVITGDADVIPAIKIAYPEYAKNVFVVTTHPEQLKKEERQSSFALSDFKCCIDQFYLEENAISIMKGDDNHICSSCNEIFTGSSHIPSKIRKYYCSECYQART
jgi:hypothetical protein